MDACAVSVSFLAPSLVGMEKIHPCLHPSLPSNSCSPSLSVVQAARAGSAGAASVLLLLAVAQGAALLAAAHMLGSPFQGLGVLQAQRLGTATPL